MATALKHNGGRSQTNLNLLNISGEYPFINWLKDASGWSYADNSGSLAPNEMDVNGYPNDNAVLTAKFGVKTLIFTPRPSDEPGPWVITWSGIAVINLAMDKTYESGYSSADLTSLTAAGGRVEFTTADTYINLGISSIGTPGISDIKVFLKSDETELNAGGTFGTKLKQRLTEANFGCIRFLNWQFGNTSNATDFGSLKSESYCFWSSHEFRNNLYASAGATRSGTSTLYTCVAPSHYTDGTSWSGLKDKATVQVRFNSTYPTGSNTVCTFSSGSATITTTSPHTLAVNDLIEFNWDTSASTMPTNIIRGQLGYVVSVPTSTTLTFSYTQGGTAITADANSTGTIYYNAQLYINVGSTGSKRIFDSYSGGLDYFGNSYPVADRIATLVYDQLLDGWIKWGGDAALGPAGLYNGIPPSVCFRLCAELGADPWFVSPHLSMDPLTDMMPTIAAYCRDNQPSWMRPIFEGPNELWNTAGGFFQTIYADNKASAYGWGNFERHNWYGKIMSVLGQAVSSVYSADRTKYDVMAGVQTGTYTDTAGSDPRLKSTKWLADGSGNPTPYIKDQAYKWVTAICAATYWNSAVYANQAEADCATAYAAASEPNKTNISNYVGDGCLTLQPNWAAVYVGWRDWALGMPTPITRMMAYEGCYSPDYHGSADIINLRYQSKTAPSLYSATLAMYDAFTRCSTSTFTSKYPSNFIIGDFQGQSLEFLTSYAWSVFMGDIYRASTPQWEAICSYNSSIRAPNLRIKVHG
jgi:hypothetical protein